MLHGNSFLENNAYQNLLVKDYKMRGFLVEHHSDMSNSTFSMIGNYAKYNKMLGNQHGSLFAIFGGLSIISNNLFAFNGYFGF